MDISAPLKKRFRIESDDFFQRSGSEPLNTDGPHSLLSVSEAPAIFVAGPTSLPASFTSTASATAFEGRLTVDNITCKVETEILVFSHRIDVFIISMYMNTGIRYRPLKISV